MTAPLLTLPEVATLLSVSVRTVKRYIQSGQLRVIHLSPRCLRVRPSEVDAFLAACERHWRRT